MQACRLGAMTLLLLPSVACGDDWQTLFNGKDLSGWQANASPGSFTVADGAIKANAAATAAHLFYVGDRDDPVRFKDFELELVVRGEPKSNSGVFLHSAMPRPREALYLDKGYEVQLNSTPQETRKTGSLYDVVDLDESPVDETNWFTVRIAVRGKNITVHLDDQKVVDYTEPDNVKRPADRAGRKLDPHGGAIALQAHDPKSVFYFKSIRIRALPPL